MAYLSYKVGCFHSPTKLPSHGCRYFYKKAIEILKNRNKPKVTILNLRGSLNAGQGARKLNYEKLKKPIDSAFAPKDLKEVCLVINSLGGSPQQSELIADRIIYLSEKKKVLVTSFVEDAAVSGGYWLACAGSNIYTTRSSLVGSIGVVSMKFGFQELIKKLGIENRIKTKGKNKAFWDPFSPETPEGNAINDKIMQRIYDNFTDFIKTRRGEKLKANGETLFTGEAWVGQDGLDLGLIDGFNSVHLYLDEKYGGKVKIVEINKGHPFASYFNTSVSEIFHSEMEEIALRSKYKL